ncbi:MAG TPA: SpoIIE family protein phosphatase [Solirubrobacteraceae bacterium]|nr:SpoIIE family protein phosphatase [Solirubrobacteraceae bacterium]
MGSQRGAADERFELLAGIAAVANGTLRLEETVDRLLGIIVPAFADFATIVAAGDGGIWRRLGARLGPPATPQDEERLRRRQRVSEAPLGMSDPRRATSLLVPQLTEDHLQSAAVDQADLELLRSLRLGSALFVPLRARGRTLGALGCAVRMDRERYDGQDVRFAEVMSGRIALALDAAGLSETITGLELRFEVVLQKLAEAVLVRDASGAIVFANPAAAQLLEVASPDDVVGAPRGDFMRRYAVTDPLGGALEFADLPSARAARGEHPEPMLVRNVNRQTGRERWFVDKASPVFDPAGDVSLVVTIVEDVTEVKRAEVTQRLLAEAGRELSSSLNYEQTLQRVARLAVPDFADWCGVRVRGAGELLDQVAVAHVDPAKVTLAREFGERYPSRLSDRRGVAQVIRTGEPQVIHISEELLAAADASEEQIEFVRQLEMRSLLIAPLAVAGQPPIGALTLVRAESGRAFTDDDLTVALELGRRAGAAVENARLYTELSQIAGTLQQSLLPPELPDLAGFRLASLYRAAGSQNDVGGDFYDVFSVPSGWIAVVGDVAGRGAEAAALTSLARYTLRTASRLLDDPIAAVQELNLALLERPRLSLVSVCYVLVREERERMSAEVILAGHPPAYRLHEGEPEPVGAFAPFLGLDGAGGWRTTSVELAAGDQLVLYTDGVIDTVGEADRFGERRLADALRGSSSAGDTVRQVHDALRDFARGPQSDDTAILVLERVPARLPAGSRVR